MTAGPPSGELRHIPVDAIRQSVFNPRKRFDPAALEELAESIREVGVLQPIVVRPWLDPAVQGEAFEIIAGERRWRASKLAGLATIPAMVRADVADPQLVRLAIIENVKRRDLDALEEAAGYRSLAALGMKQADIAAQVGRSQPVIAKAIGLLDLPEDVQDAIQEGKLTPSHGHALLRFARFPKVVSALAALGGHDPSSALEDKMVLGHHGWDLQHQGLIRVFGYDQDTFREDCDTSCPFHAYFPGFGGANCLNPEHFDELTAAAKAEAKAKMAAATAAGGADPNTPIPIRSMSWMDYKRRDGSMKPKGCSKACPCARTASGDTGDTFPICVNPERFEALRKEEQRQDRAAQKVEHKHLQRAVASAIDSLPMNVNHLALVDVCMAALERVGKSAAIETAVKRNAPELAKSLGEVRPSIRLSESREKLRGLHSIQLLRLTAEAIYRGELLEKFDGYGGSKGLTDAFLKANCWWDAVDAKGWCASDGSAGKTPCNHVKVEPAKCSACGYYPCQCTVPNNAAAALATGMQAKPASLEEWDAAKPEKELIHA